MKRLLCAVSCLLTLAGCVAGPQAPVSPTRQIAAASDCHVREIRKVEAHLLKVFAPDGHRFVVSDEDERGTPQIYVGDDNDETGERPVCITCRDVPGGPQRSRAKMQPRWHPSGKWLTIAVERDTYTVPPVLGWNRDYVEGQLQNGLWTNMYAITPDGEKWRRLTDFASGDSRIGDGYTGPAFTADGTMAVWSQAMDGNIVAYYPFGRWQLTMADVVTDGDMPAFTNRRDITPKGMFWNEPGNFRPDGESLLLSGSTEKDAQGMDQFILNVRTGELVNLTNSPTVWDEHGLFSPDGRQIVFMSAFPYRDDPGASKVLSIKTEFMLMEPDGLLTQLTHFRTPGYPESSNGIAATAEWAPDGRTLAMRALVFPNYENFELTFRGPCGRQLARV